MTCHALFETQPKFGVRPFEVAVGRPGRYTKHAEDYVSRFFKLVRKWRAETAYASSTSEMFNHSAFIEIVRMGVPVIPLIVFELKRQPDLLVAALTRITGENPVSTGDRGNVYAMASAWIEWYQRRAK
jgi:hypothetical protein